MDCLKPYWAVQEVWKNDHKIKVLPSWIAPPESSKELKVFQLPCGKCILCKQRRAFEIAVRARCESVMYESNSFITLTVDNFNLPSVFPGRRLDHRPFQLFMKRLRKHGVKCRYLMCGEYGEHTHRPHYHCILFGWMPSDSFYDDQGYRHGSRLLEKCWPYGLCRVDKLNDNRIFYVAGYTLKASPKEFASYCKWSRRPGLGYEFLRQYYPNVYQKNITWYQDDQGIFKKINGFVSSFIVGKRKMNLSIKYFNEKLFDLSPEKYDILQVSKEEYGLLATKKSAPSALLHSRNLKNRAAHIEYQLARKARELETW